MKRTGNPIIIIGVLFFVFGFVTWLGPVLIPYLRITCQLNEFAPYLVAFSLYISYTVMGLPSSYFLKLTGYKKGMSAALLIMAAGSLLFIPAALNRSYMLFLTGLFVQGTGLAILQTAANPYVTMLGPIESAAKRISIMGICNGTAGIIGPLVLGTFILENADNIKTHIATAGIAEKEQMLNMLAHRVILPYLAIAVVLVLLSLLIFFSHLPEADGEEENQTTTAEFGGQTSIFQFPHLLLGVVALFFYVGVEVIAGDSIINYGMSMNIPLSSAKFYASCTQACMLAGYVIGIILIPKYVSQGRLLIISPLVGLVFVTVALITQGQVSVAFIALLGLSNSLVWPSIWPMAIKGLGKFTKIGSSLLIMAICGGALLPLAYGWLAGASRLTPHYAYLIVIPCYLCIFYYATAGHKLKPILKPKA